MEYQELHQSHNSIFILFSEFPFFVSDDRIPFYQPQPVEAPRREPGLSPPQPDPRIVYETNDPRERGPYNPPRSTEKWNYELRREANCVDTRNDCNIYLSFCQNEAFFNTCCQPCSAAAKNPDRIQLSSPVKYRLS